jgi:hypothetical protein
MEDDLPPGVPAPHESDSEPIRRALSTAAKLWMDGELTEAVGFVQKAAGLCALEALSNSATAIRARALAAVAAELDEYVKSWSMSVHGVDPSTARVPSTVDTFSDLALSSEEHAAGQAPAPRQDAPAPVTKSAHEIAHRFGPVADLRSTLAQAPRPATPSPSQPLPPPSSRPAGAPASKPARAADLPADFRRTLQQGQGASGPSSSPFSSPLGPISAPPTQAPARAEPKPLYRPEPAAPQQNRPATVEPETRRVDPIPWSDPHSSVPTQPAPLPPTTRKPAEGEEYPPAPDTPKK